MGNLYLTVIRLMAQLSTHILQLPSFFGMNNAGTTQGLKLYLIKPFCINSSTCLLSSAC